MAVSDAVSGSGHPAQRGLVAVIGGAWSLRLSVHLLADRVVGQPEDGRYVALRRHLGARADVWFFAFFQAQALLAAVLSLPFLLACSIPSPPLHPAQVAGLGLVVGGVGLETLADRQLAAFRRDPGNRGRTCRRGLWAWSRHPNYFGEWLVWCGFAALALPAAHGWTALSAPLLMLWLITRVTGIPYTEAQALRSRGADYRAYQVTTSAFFPWPPGEVAPRDSSSGRSGSPPSSSPVGPPASSATASPPHDVDRSTSTVRGGRS